MLLSPLMLVNSKPFSVIKRKVLTKAYIRQYWVLVACWVTVNLFFWTWWIQPENMGNAVLFTIMTIALFYELTMLPTFYLFFLYHMARPVSVAIQRVKRMNKVQKVAMITLTVPGSESIEIVKKQMVAMKKVKYPHDSWILVDKVHSPEIEELAKSLGVFYFCRHDVRWGIEQVAAWNQPIPPFKAKTKAGNVNAWIDAYGMNYSHFTQLDIDHLPKPEYLHKVLGFFLDPKVAWVQAPSVYGNLNEWTARGSAEQELVLQGPLQMGFYGFSSTPFIIGSHCTYDMQEIKNIGGFQPTRAEDHLDTVFLAAAGKEGVFLPEAIAIGDGPENFETYMAQQFAWAFSMIQVLFNYTPKCLKNYTRRQAIQFLFVQTWYTIWSTSMVLLFAIPILSLFLNAPIAFVNFWEFTERSLLIATTATVIWKWSHRWHFPKNVTLTWSGMILHIARWPIVLSAFIQVLLKVEKPYMITVKGMQSGANRPFSLKMHMPYFILIAASLAACWYYIARIGQGAVQGYLLFAIEGGLVVLLVYVTALVKDMRDLARADIPLSQQISLRLKPLIVLFVIVFSLTVTGVKSAQKVTEAVLSSYDLGYNMEAPKQEHAKTAQLNPYVDDGLSQEVLVQGYLSQ